MTKLIGALLGALLGLGFGTIGLLDTRYGFEISGGTENSYVLAAVIAAIGAVVGALLLHERPWVIVGAIVGLALAIWLRDNVGDSGVTVQPPNVFLLLFGLPLVGGVIGWTMPRSTQKSHSRS